MAVSFLELQLLLLLTAHRDLKFYKYQVESMILSKDAALLLGLISVHGFSVAYTRYSSIYHVSSPTYSPPIHPINPNLCVSFSHLSPLLCHSLPWASLDWVKTMADGRMHQYHLASFSKYPYLPSHHPVSDQKLDWGEGKGRRLGREKTASQIILTYCP